MSIRTLVESLLQNSWLYDRIQILAGVRRVQDRMMQQIDKLHPPLSVLDVGGGTGGSFALWPESTIYICLDTDPVKLAGFRRKQPNGICLLSDGSNTPIADHSVNVVLCSFVAHHISDNALGELLSETQRVLANDGTFIFVEPLRTSRWLSKAMWSIDRGDYPRSATVLRNALELGFEIRHWEQFRVYHEYVLCIAHKRW
jgi:ubiquinone/menaquinone biosynthesis C-methylase UbiE